MKKITIIDNTPSRIQKLTELFETGCEIVDHSNNFKIESYLNVWGNKKEKPERIEYVKPGDVVLIHANDIVNSLWDKFIELHCKKKLVICFSGSGIKGLSGFGENVYYYSQPLSSELIESQWDIAGFIDAINSGHKNAHHVLFKYNPTLEAKLLIWKHLNNQYSENPNNFGRAKEVINEKIMPYIENLERELPSWYNFKKVNKNFSKKGISGLYNELFDG